MGFISFFLIFSFIFKLYLKRNHLFLNFSLLTCYHYVSSEIHEHINQCRPRTEMNLMSHFKLTVLGKKHNTFTVLKTDIVWNYIVFSSPLNKRSKCVPASSYECSSSLYKLPFSSSGQRWQYISMNCEKR